MPDPSEPLAFQIEGVIGEAIRLLALVLLIWAFIHAAIQRGESFGALGGIPKWGWLLILGFGTLLAFFQGFFLYIALGAAVYYLLETRTGLKDIREGRW